MTPAALLGQMAQAARQRYDNDKRWAAACGLPAETLSRLRTRDSCDLRTLNSLASAVGYSIVATPSAAGDANTFFGRPQEEALLDLCASGSTDPAVWRSRGDGFLMGGLAIVLASVRGFDRRRHLELGEELHPGVSQPEVFALWLRRCPLRPARFLPMLTRWRKIEA